LGDWCLTKVLFVINLFKRHSIYFKVFIRTYIILSNSKGFLRCVSSVDTIVLIYSLVEVFLIFLKPYCLIQKMTSPGLKRHFFRLILIYLSNRLQLPDKLFSCFIDNYTSVILTTSSIYPHTSGDTHTNTHTY